MRKKSREMNADWALEGFEEAVSRSLHRTAVVRLTLTEPPVGKRKQYDTNGYKMEYGKME